MQQADDKLSQQANVFEDTPQKLDYLKSCVEDSYMYFNENMKRFREFHKFVFDTSLTANDIQKLNDLGKPSVEFNILEALVSRQRGEFAKHEPGISVGADESITDTPTPEMIKQIEVLEGYFRYLLFNGNNDYLQYNVMTDLLAGGFSVVEVGTDYAHPMSMDQIITLERVFDITLCGFDPLARTSHKGDGQYCFQIYPKTQAEFEREFGKEAAKEIKYVREANKFNWSYQNQKQRIILVCDFFEKIKKKVHIMQLTNGQVIKSNQYESFVQKWNDSGRIEQAPIPIGKSRQTEIETIVRYRMSGNKILTTTKTDFTFLPLVFVDGNSVIISDNDNNNATKQMCRPWVYHAKGIQKLKNFSGQTVAAEIENMVQHKIMASVESIPEEYESVYQDLQHASTLLWNEFYEGNPEVRLTPPREIQRTPTPPLVYTTFMGSDEVTRAILGSFDSQLGIQGEDASGRAIEQGALMSSMSSIPYQMGFMKGFSRIAEIVLDLIPKYLVTPRSIPIMQANGKRSYQIINKAQDSRSISMLYDPMSLQVKVEVGVNSTVQKQIALRQITAMMDASPLFAEFINDMGLETILDNMDIRGIDQLKAAVNQWTQKKEQEKQQAMQMAQQNNPVEVQKQIEMAKIQQKAQETQGTLSIKAGELAIKQGQSQLQAVKTAAEIANMSVEAEVKKEQIDAENARSAVLAAVEVSSHLHEKQMSHKESQDKETKD